MIVIEKAEFEKGRPWVPIGELRPGEALGVRRDNKPLVALKVAEDRLVIQIQDSGLLVELNKPVDTGVVRIRVDNWEENV